MHNRMGAIPMSVCTWFWGSLLNKNSYQVIFAKSLVISLSVHVRGYSSMKNHLVWNDDKIWGLMNILYVWILESANGR